MMRPLNALVPALAALALTLPTAPTLAQEASDPLRVIAVDVEGGAAAAMRAALSRGSGAGLPGSARGPPTPVGHPASISSECPSGVM
jgi:hypothetical protein